MDSLQVVLKQGEQGLLRDQTGFLRKKYIITLTLNMGKKQLPLWLRSHPRPLSPRLAVLPAQGDGLK